MDFSIEDGLAFLEGGREFFAAAVLMEDGSLLEIGGRSRRWKTQDAFHKARGWQAGTVLKYFPATFDCDGRPTPLSGYLREKNL